MNMQVRPGYKLTEAGVLPHEWTVQSFLTLCTKIQDGTHFSPQLGGNDYLYVTSKNIRFGFLDLSTADRIDSFQHELIYRRCDTKRGDLLLTKDGANTGNAAINSIDDEISLLSSVAFLRFNSNHHSADFFLQQILSEFGQKQIKEAMSGNAITRLTLQKIKKLFFAVPPIKEQVAISAVLSDMDALISGIDLLIAKKRDIKRAAMQQLLTGQQRLPGFSGEWEMKRLGDVAEVRDGTHQTPRYVESGIPFYSVENVTSGDFVNTKFISEEEHHLLTRSFRMEKGDILMTRIGSIGDCKLIDWEVDASFYVSLALLKVRNGYLPEFICHYSRSYLFQKEIELNSLQSAIPKKINLGPISHVRMVIPADYAEQTAIATVLSDMDNELAALENRRDKALQLKNGMMQELLTGRVRLL